MPNKKELTETFLNYCDNYQDEVYEDGTRLSEQEIAANAKQEMEEDLSDLDLSASENASWQSLIDEIC